MDIVTTPVTTKTKLIKTYSYYLAFVTIGLSAAVTGPTLQQLAHNTHSQLNQISLIFTTGALGYLLGSLLIGRMYDHIPGHKIMALALLFSAIFIALIPVMPLLWLLVIVVGLNGISTSSIDVGGNILLIRVHGNKVGPFMNGLHFFFGLGALISPLIVAGVISRTASINGAYWLIALFIIPIAIWMSRLPSPDIQSTKPVQGASSTNTRLVFLITLSFFMFVGAEVAFGNWIYTYATTLNLGTTTTAAYLTSVFWGAFTIGRLLGIPIAARFKLHTIIYVDLLGCILSLIMIGIWSNSPIILWLGCIGYGLSMASIFANTMSLSERLMHMSGKITGMYLVGGSAGSMFFPWLIGQLFDPVGPQILLILLVIALVIALVIFLVIQLVMKHSKTTVNS